MLKNAIAYVTRRRNRSLIIFVILAIVLSSLYACMSISRKQSEMEKSLYESSNSSISITKKNQNGYFNPNDFEKIKQNKDIRQIIYHYEGLATLTNASVVEGSQKIMREDLSDNMRNLVSIDATSSQKKNVLFTSGVFKIKEGRNLKEDDANSILVHEDFAKKNKLKLHDKVSLKFMKMDGKSNVMDENQYEIVGIFSGKKQEKYTGFSSDYSENTMFVNYNSAQKSLKLNSNERIVNKITLLTHNQKSMDSLIRELKREYSTSSFEIQKDDLAFKEAIQSLDSVKHIISLMTYSIMIAGLVVLSLILILWLRERIYEIGILLSIGIEKSKIIGQFILELVIVSIPAAFLSIFCGDLVVKQIVMGFGKSETTATVSTRLLTTNFYDKFIVFAKSYTLLIVIIIMSVIAASSIILIKKPKEILSKIS